MPDAAVSEINEARDEAALVRQELHELLVRYQGEHESLLDHQKAFAEAKEVIARMQTEIAGLKTEREGGVLKFEEQQQVLAQLVAEKASVIDQLSQSHGRYWLTRIRQRLTRG